MTLRGSGKIQISQGSDEDDNEYEDEYDDDTVALRPTTSTDPNEVVSFPSLPKKIRTKVKKLTKRETREKRKIKANRVKLALVKPDITTDREKERILRRIATKGVVQLFNAVADRQNTMSEELKKKLSSKERRQARERFSGKNFDVNKYAERDQAAAKKEMKEEEEMEMEDDQIDDNNYSDED
ncbi:unnamed protein product [Caenorhabditis auriculariae]|uniref:RRP15-like protein n=1 Tax=Caenorhabditis auriculariae TaxID=2777116 RepID=A0A8S1HFD9_9PELO|nr:unnamed protein product [Caenorhabditis auriculariae]